MTENTIPGDTDIHDVEANAAGALRAKLFDAMTPGFIAEFDPDEAEEAGAFAEDGLSEADALASVVDFSETTTSRIFVAENDLDFSVVSREAVARG